MVIFFLPFWYLQINKEKIAEKNKQYREANKEKISKREKQYYEANKEKISKRKKKYNQDNREKRLKRQKQYREANKDKIAEYRNRNMTSFKHYKAKRRSAKKDQTPDYANLDLIKLIYENCPDGYEVDHMVPISCGGLHYESNLCYLPKSINCSKGAKTIEEFGLDVFNDHVIYWQDVV